MTSLIRREISKYLRLLSIHITSSLFDGEVNSSDFRLMDEGHTSFVLHDLPDSIILQIFCTFTIKERLLLRRVCWRWHYLLKDYSVWKSIDLSEDSFLSSKVNNNILEGWITAWGKTIQQIDVSDCRWLTDVVVQKVAQNCADLRDLNVEGCFQVSDAGMNAIASNCMRLKRLNVFLSGVSEQGFDRLLKQCPNLENVKLGTIDLTWCCFITDDALFALPFCCPNLKSFTVRECHQISDRGVRAVFQICHLTLSKVHLERLYSITDVLTLSPEDLKPFPNLSFLKMIDTSISDVGVAKIAEKSPNLQTLIVGEHCFNPYNIHGGFIPTIAETCQKLRRFKLYSGRMKDNYLTAIAENIPFITDLYLGDCRDCTAQGLNSIILRCRWLQILHILNCSHVTNKTLVLISRNLTDLKELEILNCRSITTQDVLELKRKLPQCDVRY
ncbi:F-box/LRR-repeat protein 20-like [Stylophora pistillata]|uniref:F-box/LRR-repeat protein 20-like n=1 Tax=Stylophora pistillata TaxID=50429 RepID=UPI000C048B5C|nr:F-box/LRR-repeat protein 20-like [Stylophora pistillata]